MKTTNGGGAIYTDVNEISGKVPDEFALNQNYPNPFNPVTSIEFSIPKSLQVKLSVFDLSAREVEVLIHQFMQAGTYKVVWDASAFASGAYFYRLVTPNFIQTRKMILMR